MSHPMYPDAPWITAPLRLKRAALSAIEEHARAAYPSECCGFLFGPESEPTLLDEAQPETNEADKYHQLDPETFPRTSRTYFKINEMRAARSLDASTAAGRPLKVIYHSHCDAGAYFSEEDSATFSQSGQLMWPCAFLVVSVVEGEVRETRLWAHVPNTDTFIESELHIE